MRIIMAMVLAITVATAVYGGTASAATPAEKACIGELSSTNARSESIDYYLYPWFGGDGWHTADNLGEVNSFFAKEVTYPGDTPGLGEEIQWLQSGVGQGHLAVNPCYVP